MFFLFLVAIQPPDKLSAPSINVIDYFKSPPISLADFVKDKDPTNIVMLCIDLGMPLLVLDGEHLLVTDHSIHCNQPSYWTIEPNFKCQRIIFDENEKRGVDKSTSDINNLHKPTLKVKSFAKADAENALDKINGLRVPEDIYLENKSYKKLSHVPLVYAQVGFNYFCAVCERNRATICTLSSRVLILLYNVHISVTVHFTEACDSACIYLW